jgi:hypothetical protein
MVLNKGVATGIQGADPIKSSTVATFSGVAGVIAGGRDDHEATRVHHAARSRDEAIE